MSKKGIDVSHHQGVIDWNKVKAAGIEFALPRTSYGVENEKQIDSQFERNYSECKRLGIPVEAYHYSYAANPAEAKRELDFFFEDHQRKNIRVPRYVRYRGQNFDEAA